MLVLETVKNYLKIDYNDEDIIIESFINVAENYLYSITGKVEEGSDQFYDLKMEGKEIILYTDSQLKLVEIYCLAFVSELYNNRSITVDKVEQNLRYIYQTVLNSLIYGGNL